MEVSVFFCELVSFVVLLKEREQQQHLYNRLTCLGQQESLSLLSVLDMRCICRRVEENLSTCDIFVLYYIHVALHPCA